MLGTLTEDRSQAPQRSLKPISLMLITALIYMAIGHISRNFEFALYWYLAIVLCYNYLLLVFAENRTIMLAIGIAFYAIEVVTLHYANPSLSLDRLPILSFCAAINLPIIVYSNIKAGDRNPVKAISMATIIPWLGLIVGWLIPSYTAIS